MATVAKSSSLKPDSQIALSGRGRMGTLTGFEVAATGSYVPEQVVTNEDLSALGCDSDWIIQRTGIRERRKAADDEAASDLALKATQACLENGKISPSEIDMILVATITPDHASPSTACHLQHSLGCIAPAMDLNAACAGFSYGLITGAQYIATGFSKCVLVVGTDVMSRTVDPRDVKTYPLFADGAGAAILRPSGDHSKGLLSYTLGAEGCRGKALCLPSGGSAQPLTPEIISEGKHFMQMDGRAVFKWAVRVIVESSQDCLAYAGLTADDIDLVVMHQANVRILDSAIADLGFPREKVVVNLDRYGNTSSASIPLALDEALAAGQASAGDKVLFCGFGSGLAWGTGILQL
ncbi:MAG: beta-ketoacyl-ACP synthase III [Pirellulaceae bacterium]